MTPKTLTEAASAQPVAVMMLSGDWTASNTRDIPYEETYRESTGVMETPAQRWQRITRASGS